MLFPDVGEVDINFLKSLIVFTPLIEVNNLGNVSKVCETDPNCLVK